MQYQSHPLPSVAPVRIGEPFNQRWPLLQTTQIRSLESAYAEARLKNNKSPGYPPTLMESAGLSLAKLCLALSPNAEHIWIACGPGNNGGDGIVAAIELQKLGKKPYVSFCGKRIEGASDISAPYSIASSTSLSPAFSSPIGDHVAAQLAALSHGIELHKVAPPQWDFAIDALLGIGIDQKSPRAIEGVMAQWLNLINTADSPVLCVDAPSGLCTDTGRMCAINAQDKETIEHPPLNLNQKRYTLTFLGLKPGLFTGTGKDFAGDIWLEPLVDSNSPVDNNADPIKGFGGLGLTAHLNTQHPVTSRAQNSHKGTYSDVIILGGAKGMQGAAVLAGTSALHMGAGRVYLCLIHESEVSCRISPALMTRFAQDISKLAVESATVVCGCGGGTEIAQYLSLALEHSRNLVLDADGLNAVATDQELKALVCGRHARGLSTVLTPHPLEAARLLGKTVTKIQANRIQSAEELACLFKCTVVLKGAGSVIAQYTPLGFQPNNSEHIHLNYDNFESHDGRTPDTRDTQVCINPTGCALLATAGTGDVLAGMIGALLAQNEDPWLSACEGVFIHGLTAQNWNLQDSFDAELLAARVTYPRLRN